MLNFSSQKIFNQSLKIAVLFSHGNMAKHLAWHMNNYCMSDPYIG